MSDAAMALHFGGPDRPPRALRDLLQQRVDAVPPGGEIVWATYYFRDRALAEALIAASDRGVRVVLHMEASPRRRSANRPVADLLARHGLNGGLHLHAPAGWLPRGLHSHLHSKIYIFSGPTPAAFVGSFNPSGDIPEDADVIAEIGDQDRGHNLLAECRDPALIAALRGQVLAMSRPLARWRPAQNRIVRTGGTLTCFYPRLRTDIVGPQLARAGAGTRIRGAISHLKRGSLVDALTRAAASGAAVGRCVHDTERRVPEATVAHLAAAGIAIERYRHPEQLPLHAKFLLVENGAKGEATAWIGSFNHNPRSRWLNREILMASSAPALIDGLGTRFDQIAAEIAAMRDRI